MRWRPESTASGLEVLGFALLALIVPCVPACSEPPEDDAHDGVAVAGESDEAPPAPAAMIRFVHLWAHEGAAAPIDLYVQQGFEAQKPAREGLELGEVVWLSVPGNATLYAYRSGEDGVGDGYGAPALVSVEDLESELATGLPLTVALLPAPSIGDRAGGDIRVFLDAGEHVVGNTPTKAVEGGLLVADMTALGQLAGDPIRGIKLGTPASGCLQPAGATSRPGISASIGGTAVVLYDVPAGQAQIAAYSMELTACEGTPRVGPIVVDVAAGERTYVFGYGTSTDDLRLLALSPSGTN